MASASPAAFSWRGLLQSIFDIDDDALGSAASPLASARTPRWSRRSGRHSASSAGDNNDDDAAVDAPPYTPSRLDGECNVWFAHKPLGLGLVPSTQLYGTWEIASVAAATPSRHGHDDEVVERAKIQRGDVLLAVNFDTAIAKLPRDAFASYLEQCTCPVVVTLRRPAVYGSFDSRALSTAMFPASIEYRETNGDPDHKTFLARAPSMQWKRSLKHELAQKKKMTERKNKRETTSKHAFEPTPENDASVALSSVTASPTDAAHLQASTLVTAELSLMGEFTATFHSIPLAMELAPSTRLYGSVEVYDPKEFTPLIQIGDVVMAVDGDTSVARWPMDEAIEHINHRDAPVTLTFRRPAAYRQYLEAYFKSTHIKVLSSRSTATAMFPDSAEYKHGHIYRRSKKKKSQQRRGSRGYKDHRDRVDGQGQLTKDAWHQVSKHFDASDQFKLWQSSASKRQTKTSKNPTTAKLQTSAFLTERHVQYLWAHLPAYLTCNDMELVYDTRRDGWNLLSFYAHVQDKGPTLLVVKDTNDQIFGAFSSTSWKQSADVYGNGRCFVFSLRPQMKVYTWSGLNDTFMSGRRDAILMGGGQNGIALCLQVDELRGFSTACETFDSPSLASVRDRATNGFEMENLEVWCFSGLRV